MMMIGAQCTHDITMSGGLVASLFLVGLVGGATHCVAMCSPFVLAQIDGKPNIRKLGSSLLLPYHLGRMTTYVALAILVSSIINLAFVNSGLKSFIAAPMLVVAGVIFIVTAIPKLTVLFPWAVNIRFTAGYRLIAKFSGGLMKKQNALGRYGLGMLLGFMPCGLVVSALLASATAPSAMGAGLAMAAFSVGTMPALMAVALGGNALKYKFPKQVGFVSKGAMLASGIWLFVLAGTMVL